MTLGWSRGRMRAEARAAPAPNLVLMVNNSKDRR